MKNNLTKFITILFLIVLTTVSAWAFSFRNMTLDFVQISDTHISTNRDDTSYKALGSSSALLKDAIEQINDIKGLDFVMFTGDMVDSATVDNYREYYKLLTKLHYPTLNTFGNHDISYGDLSRQEVLEIVKKCNPNYTFSDTYYAFSPKTDYRIIVLDPVITDRNTSNGSLSDEQLQFLDNELSQNQDKIVLIAMHIPSVQPFVAQEHALLNANEFNEILIKYKNPIVVISGHYHATKIRRAGNIVFVSTPSLVTYPMGFRHIKITNYKDRVTYKFDFLTTRLDDIKESNRQSVISYATLAGYEKDRETSFTYRKKQHKSIRYKRNQIKKASKTTKTKKSEIKKLMQHKELKPKKERRKLFGKNKKSETPIEQSSNDYIEQNSVEQEIKTEQEI